jgi:hypothetical protein
MFYSMRVIHLYSFGVRVVLWGASGCGGVSLGGSVVHHGADVLRGHLVFGVFFMLYSVHVVQLYSFRVCGILRGAGSCVVCPSAFSFLHFITNVLKRRTDDINTFVSI